MAFTPVNGLEIYGDFTSDSGGGMSSVTVLALAADKKGFVTTTVTSSADTWDIINAGYTASSGECLSCDTSTGSFTVTLPASPSANDNVAVADYAGTFGTYPLIVSSPDADIVGLAESFYCDIDNLSITFVYIDSIVGWRVV